MNKRLERVLYDLERKNSYQEHLFSEAIDLVLSLPATERKEYEERLKAFLDSQSSVRSEVKGLLHSHPYPRTYTGRNKYKTRRTASLH